MFEGIQNLFVLIYFAMLVFLNQGVQNTLPQTDNLIQEKTVVEVIDGDTIDVFLEDQVQRVRLIGVNTPETVDRRRGVQCYGPEASKFLKELLTGKIVNLEEDPTQYSKDNYGRLLRYVYLNEENINQKLIKEGYGFEYTYKKPYKYQSEFREAQRDARDNYKGLWNPENCEY